MGRKVVEVESREQTLLLREHWRNVVGSSKSINFNNNFIYFLPERCLKCIVVVLLFCIEVILHSDEQFSLLYVMSKTYPVSK